MSLLFKADVEGFGEVDITANDIDALDVEKLGEGKYHILKDNKSYVFKIVDADLDEKRFTIQVDGKKISLSLLDKVELQVREMGLDVIESDSAKEIIAPMPGMVLSVNVSKGDSVAKGDAVLILEAMKMENVLEAPGDGVVSEVHIKPGDPVDKSQLLISFED